jgi:hypothetical protein
MDEVYDIEELDSAKLEELGLTKEELVELAIAQTREQYGVKEDNTFCYGFNNGLGMDVTYTDGIYSVDIILQKYNKSPISASKYRGNTRRVGNIGNVCLISLHHMLHRTY